MASSFLSMLYPSGMLVGVLLGLQGSATASGRLRRWSIAAG